AELEVRHQLLDVLDVTGHRHQRVVVRFTLGELEELRGIPEAGVDLLDVPNGVFEGAALLAEVLRLLRVVPDLRVLEVARDLYEARLLRVVVKDTSATLAPGWRGRG